jgi:RHS repeat-associated protein
VTNPASWTTSTLFDPAWGLATRVTDPNNRVTELDYDALGRLTAQWSPGWSRSAHPSLPNQTYTYLVRSSGGPSVITTNALNTDGTGAIASFQLLDANLRVRQTQTLAAGGVGRVITDTFYDSRALQTKTNAPYYATSQPDSTLQVTSDSAIPSQTRTTYDGAGRTTVTALVSQSVEKWRTTVAYGGDRTDTTPPAGGTATSNVVDARGKQIELRQYTGGTPTPFIPASFARTTFTYDHAGRMTSTVDPAGITWQWGYDQRGRNTSRTDPDKGTTALTYDDAGQLVITTDARGILLGYTYDQLGRRRTEWRDAITTGTKLAESTYDTAPDTAGIAGHPIYGQLGSTTRWVAGNAYVTSVAGYDAANRATGTAITIPAAQTGLAGTYTFAMTYNADGSVATTSMPAAGGLPAETLTTAYTTTGLPYTLTGVTQYVSDTTYLETGQITSLTNNTTVAYQGFNYDPTTMRLDSTNVQANTFPDILADVRYTYDPAGNITQVANLLAQYGTGYGADDTQCFSYDNLRRLTQAWTPASNSCTAAPSVSGLGGAAPYWLSWSFDSTGNRTGRTRHTSGGDQITTSTYPIPAAAHPHALTATSGAATGSYSYDAAGNTTSRPGTTGQQTLTWDAEGHLATLTEGTSTSNYLYDVDNGRLVTRDATGATLHLPYGMEVHVDPAGGNATGTRLYSHDDTVVASRSAGTGLFWIFADRQGTAGLALRDSDLAISRRWQAPYGTARGTTTSWPNQHSYLGGFADASALVHLGARDYDPAAGRFLTLDPVQDLNDPQQWNGYAYSDNSPVTFSDPTGLEHDEEAGPGYTPPARDNGGPTGRTRDEEYQPQPVNNGDHTGRTRDEYQWVPAPKPATPPAAHLGSSGQGPTADADPSDYWGGGGRALAQRCTRADDGTYSCRTPEFGSSPSTYGECVAGDAQLGYGVSVATCHVHDSLGNEAMLMITVAPGDAVATPGASVIAGGMLANGSIADQAGEFTFVTVSWGEGFAGGVTYARGTGNECHCTVKSAFVGGGVGIGGGITFGRSCTEIAWITPSTAPAKEVHCS